MKKALATLLVFCCAIIAVAQDTSEVYSPHRKAKCFAVNFKSSNTTLSIPGFRNILVYDVRPDTTKMGYFTTNLTNVFYKFCTDPNFFSEYYNSLFRPADANGHMDVVIFITKAWISSQPSNNQLSLSAEFFAKSEEGYHPLYRFDTIANVTGAASDNAEKFQPLLDSSVSKLTSLNIQSKLKRVLSIADIENRYANARFKANKVVQTGVYRTFEEFKNDRPYYKNFHVEFSNLSDELFIKEGDGNFYLSRSAWGFFDGKTVFIRVGDNYFPVDQNDPVLTFFAASAVKKQAITHVSVPSPYQISVAAVAVDYLLRSKKRKLVKLRPYQLNTLTGEVY